MGTTSLFWKGKQSTFKSVFNVPAFEFFFSIKHSGRSTKLQVPDLKPALFSRKIHFKFVGGAQRLISKCSVSQRPRHMN